jgi:hypothetical protein
MKKVESAWDTRIAKDRPIARSQPKFPWQVQPPTEIEERSEADQDLQTGTEKAPVTSAQKVPVTGAKKAPVQKIATGTEKVSDTEKAPVATFRIPHQELDYLFRELDGCEFKVYLRLFRLSHGWGVDSCQVGDNNLMTTLNISKNALRAAKRGLMDKQLISIIRTVNLGPKGFTEYTVLRAGEENKANWYLKGTSTKKVTDTQKDPIKEDHDHDDLKQDHQREVMMIYQHLTGNEWKQSDEQAYAKISTIPLDHIEQGIRLAKQRATSRPNSLNYFVKEITNLARPSEQSKTQRRKALEKIVTRVRDRNVGAAPYRLSDLAEDVKCEAARDGVAFDNDLFNQIIGA